MSGGYEIVVWALLIISSLTDLVWGKVFNAVTFSFAATGLVCRFAISGMPQATEAATAIAAALIFFFPLYLLKTMAAGDVKLLMALGAWTSAPIVIRLGMVSILLGAVVGTFLMLRTRGMKASLGSVAQHVKAAAPTTSYRMPFAPAFLCGYMILQIAEIHRWPLF